MPETCKSLLVVAVPASIFARFPPLLWRDVFDVNTVENPRLASVIRIEQRALSPRCCGAQFLELDDGSLVKLDHYLTSLAGGESG